MQFFHKYVSSNFFNAIFIHVAFDHKQIPYMVGGTRILIFINLTWTMDTE